MYVFWETITIYIFIYRGMCSFVSIWRQWTPWLDHYSLWKEFVQIPSVDKIFMWFNDSMTITAPPPNLHVFIRLICPNGLISFVYMHKWYMFTSYSWCLNKACWFVRSLLVYISPASTGHHLCSSQIASCVRIHTSLSFWILWWFVLSRVNGGG